jgi:hypothetical protein
MRLSGGRLTLLLTTVLVLVLSAGATAAWSFGRSDDRVPVAMADYQQGPSDSSTVRLSTRASAHPRAAEVRRLLQDYFDAINKHDYGSWMRTVAAEQSAPQTRDRWRADYASTVDSNIAVMTVSDEPLRARTMFTSQQDVALAPPSLPEPCINWDVTYLLGDRDGRLVLTGTYPSAQSMKACQ